MRIKKCKDAVQAVLNDNELWSRIPAPNNKAHSQPDFRDWDGLTDLLDGKLAHLMTRVGYRSTDEAQRSIQTLRDTISYARRPDLPTLTRQEVVGGVKTGLRELYRALDGLQIEGAVTGMDGFSCDHPLNRVKPALVDMMILGEIVGQDGSSVVLRVDEIEAVDIMLDDAFRWLTCHGHRQDPRSSASAD
ncbi:hypothetical protein PHK61_30820 [Actinomycetospora lutea]|uniref:hypothetical protein n=1 Tax=Actinomycetospora lutea TaxID=663604 RepID=UPI002365C1CA|nr:hypothetical protein [Actinomycetospora lutea]MDD7942816.1 hypothetical protein [Actinomycetospora lutea]